jgi:hypothetical protein
VGKGFEGQYSVVVTGYVMVLGNDTGSDSLNCMMDAHPQECH